MSANPPETKPVPAKAWGEIPAGALPAIQLPPIISLDEFLSDRVELPEVLVDGLIRKRSVVMFASASKSYKTWTLLHLALCVAEGMPWLGRSVTAGRVLFLNFELSAAELQHRFSEISGAMALSPQSNLDVCNLRGHATDISRLMPEVIKRCEGKEYSMIIPDPIYSMMGDRNENAANEMADFLNHLSLLSEATGAAVVYTHHFAKGMASSKEQIDRASGSGVFARHADGIITLTRHEQDNAFVVEAELRSFRRPDPFTIKWEYPLMETVDLDPRKLKNKAGRPSAHTVADLTACLPPEGLSSGDWKAVVAKSRAMSASTFYELKKRATADGLVSEKNGKWIRNPKVVSINPMSGGTAIRDSEPQPAEAV
jgi:hypothetical protein